MAHSLEIRLLGPFEAVAEGRRVPVTGSKQEALLALLALQSGRLLAVDALIDALWGAEMPAGPRNALQHHVMRLRAALGHDTIAGTADGYALEDAAVDVVQFEQLLAEARTALRQGEPRTAAAAAGRGLALWRGPALQGLPDQPWVAAEARRLEALRIDAVEEELEAALALGEHAELAPRIRRVLAEHPFRERLWGQLMLALYRGGRQAEALEVFQEARRVLAAELGLDPGPELQRLQSAILAHDPAVAAIPTSPRRRGNLPAPLTSFVGRADELALVLELLGQGRLVTLTGAPGVGKSRLALEAVRSIELAVPDGAWLVELARADSGADVIRLIADTVDARGPTLDDLTTRLADAAAVLLLDGCERVVADVREIAATVLSTCPDVRVLATSREVLRLTGEARVVIAPLAVPDGDPGPIASSVATDLFVERARAARPGFQLSTDTAPLVAEICRRLDGLPLAIELAAARVSVLGLSEILGSLDRRLPAMLEAGAVTGGETLALETLVAWSYDLLHSDEKALLHQLAVYRGGASLSALTVAAAAGGLDETTTTRLVAALVDKSVVTVAFPGGEARYYLLDSVREYARERLRQLDGLVAAREAHAAYFVALAEAVRGDLRGPGWSSALTRLKRENDNLWVALAFAREAPAPLTAARLGAALGWYFALAGRVSEGRQFLEQALAPAAETPVHLQVELLSHLSYLHAEEGDLAAAIDVGERGLAEADRFTPAPTEEALVRISLASAHARAGDHERAVRLAAQARAAFEGRGEHWGVAASVLVEAIGAVGAGDVSRTETFAAIAARHADAIAYEAFQVPAALIAAWVAEQRDDLDAAALAYRRALDLAEAVAMGDHASFALAGLGAIAFTRGNLREAEELSRRALAVADAVASPWLAAHARVRLARTLDAQGDTGAAASLNDAVARWSRTPPPPQHARELLFVALAGDPAQALPEPAAP
jgi:predicted ATPase/DNA-binding SARP family transcriptional activator